MPEKFKIRRSLLFIDCLSLLASKCLARIRNIRSIFILLAEKLKRISHVEWHKLDLKEIMCEV
jgi:hypothetical protein